MYNLNFASHLLFLLWCLLAFAGTVIGVTSLLISLRTRTTAVAQGAPPMRATRHLHLRFSIRTLAIVVTLACCYLACWGPTQRWGRRDVMLHAFRDTGLGLGRDEASIAFIEQFYDTPEVSVPLPLVVSILNGRQYYFWFFGYVVELPFELSPLKAASTENRKNATQVRLSEITPPSNPLARKELT